MGFALAQEAQARGAQVTLVAGPVSLSTPLGVERIDVISSEEMLKACQKKFPQTNVFIATAAVGDYTPFQKATQKIKKSEKKLTLEMKPTVDILKTLAEKKRKGQIVVGFAAETERVLKHGMEKLKKKNLDLLVANDVSKSDRGFGSDQNVVFLLEAKGKIGKSDLLPKSEIAKIILDKVELIFKSHR